MCRLNALISYLRLKKCFSFTDKMRISYVGKRHPPFQHWEPIYIGTHEDPLYDERLSWEGKADKMTQVSLQSSLQFTFFSCPICGACVNICFVLLCKQFIANISNFKLAIHN